MFDRALIVIERRNGRKRLENARKQQKAVTIFLRKSCRSLFFIPAFSRHSGSFVVDTS
jgi:hypothetical protein